MATGTMAEAVAVQGNKILQVGTNREVQRLRRPQTVVVDAHGGAVLPGFNDAHTHLLSGGLSLNQINLLDAKTLPAIETRCASWAAAHPDRDVGDRPRLVLRAVSRRPADATDSRRARPRSARVPDVVRRTHRLGEFARR